MAKKKILTFKAPRLPEKIWQKYAEQTGAIVGNEIVAGGKTTTEAIKNAQKLYPKLKDWEIGIMTLPPREGVWVL